MSDGQESRMNPSSGSADGSKKRPQSPVQTEDSPSTPSTSARQRTSPRQPKRHCPISPRSRCLVNAFITAFRCINGDICSHWTQITDTINRINNNRFALNVTTCKTELENIHLEVSALSRHQDLDRELTDFLMVYRHTVQADSHLKIAVKSALGLCRARPFTSSGLPGIPRVPCLSRTTATQSLSHADVSPHSGASTSSGSHSQHQEPTESAGGGPSHMEFLASGTKPIQDLLIQHGEALAEHSRILGELKERVGRIEAKLDEREQFIMDYVDFDSLAQTLQDSESDCDP